MRQPELLEFNEFGKVPKQSRGYLDGCFDLCHAGHYNAVRQAAQLTDRLVFGLNSDAEILANKGPPVMNGEERMKLVRACKWVKESEFSSNLAAISISTVTTRATIQKGSTSVRSLLRKASSRSLSVPPVFPLQA